MINLAAAAIGASIIEVMSEQTPQTPESPETPTDSFPPVAASDTAAPAAEHKSGKTHTILAWVGIIAGSVFIVATIFFSGFFMGAHAGGCHHGWHKHHHGKDSSQFSGDHEGRGGWGGWHHGHHGPGMWHPMGPGGMGGPGFPGGDGGPAGPGGPGGPGSQPAPPAPPAQPGR